MEYESYVSFRTALKLKDAGFTWPSFGKYTNLGDSQWFVDGIKYNLGSLKSNEVLAPTLASAAKWLRNTKHISTRVHYSSLVKRWFFDTLHLDCLKYSEGEDYYQSYEAALEAAINDVLDSLNKNNL